MNIWKLLIAFGLFLIALRIVLWIFRIVWFISGLLAFAGICMLVAGTIWYAIVKRKS